MTTKNKLYTVIGILLLIPACFNTKNNDDKRTFLIQTPLDITVLKEMYQDMRPVFDDIIQEELGVENDLAFLFFKRRQAITIYDVYDMYNNGEELLISAFDTMQKVPLHSITIGSTLDFFGDPESEMIHLVVLINDPHKELSLLNKNMKQAMHKVNEEYKQDHDVNLYDIAKSERFRNDTVIYIAQGDPLFQLFKECIRYKKAS